jgi:hypothetical protein
MKRRITVTFEEHHVAAIQQALEVRARMRFGENWNKFTAKDWALFIRTATWLLADQVIKQKPDAYDLTVRMIFNTNEQNADEKRELQKLAKKPSQPARATKAAPFDMAFLKKNFPSRFS